MDSLYDFTKKVLLAMGIDLNLHAKNNIFLNALKYFIQFFVTSSCIQSLMFFYIKGENAGFLSVVSLVMGIYAIQGSVKFFFMIRNMETVKDLINKLEKLHLNLDTERQKKSLTFLLLVRKICILIFKMTMMCVFTFNLLPILKMMMIYLTKGKIEFELPYGIWWPFDQADYPFWMFPYQMYYSHLLAAVANMMDQIFFFILAEIIAQFERLSEELKEVINDSHNKSFTENKMNLNQCIEKHCSLMMYFDTIAGIYEIPLLVQILSASAIIGLVGFLLTGQDFFYTIPFIFAMVSCLAQIFLPCWFGNMIKEKVMKLNSDVNGLSSFLFP